MGFYLRKRVSLGPFRFTFSGTGVSVSTGVRGLRVGSGPRGNSVHAGGGGVYYRRNFRSHPARPVAITFSIAGLVAALLSGSIVAILLAAAVVVPLLIFGARRRPEDIANDT